MENENKSKENKQNGYKGARQGSPMEIARQSSQENQRGFNKNPYINDSDMIINESISQTQNPYYNTSANKSMTDSLLDSFDTEIFIKGALVGAVGAYLLTNETAQKAIFKGVAKTTGLLQAGMEEMKERYEDAQAELEAEQEV